MRASGHAMRVDRNGGVRRGSARRSVSCRVVSCCDVKKGASIGSECEKTVRVAMRIESSRDFRFLAATIRKGKRSPGTRAVWRI